MIEYDIYERNAATGRAYNKLPPMNIVQKKFTVMKYGLSSQGFNDLHWEEYF